MALPKRNIALLIIDMAQEQFHPNGHPIIPSWPGHAHIISLAQALPKERVFDSRLWISPADNSSLHDLYPDVGVAGREGTQLCAELKNKLQELSTFVKKIQYSSFYGSELDNLMAAGNVGVVMLAGINTDYCVFASGLDAFYRGYEVWLIEDACTTISGESGHRRGISEFKRFLGCKGIVMKTREALQRIQQREKDA